MLVVAHSYCAIAAAKPASAAPTLEVALVESTVPYSVTAAPRQASGSRDFPITWFGYVDEDGNAVEGETWTFDHGGPDPYEGWMAEATTWRQIDTAVWSGHGNSVPAPIITGTGSAWVGCFQDKADLLGWAAGLGYGNSWFCRFESPAFTWDGPDEIGLSFNYWVDLEYDYDYLRVYLHGTTTGEEVLLTAFTGIYGDYSSPESFVYSLSESEFEAIGGDEATLVFELLSDSAYSDEDGYYATEYGPFGIDDIALTDHVSGGDILYTFDSDDEGFISSMISGGINPISNYNIPCGPCPLSGNVLHMHDANQEHPDGQYTIVISPPATLPEPGCFVFAEYDGFFELSYYDGVFYRPGWMYTTNGTTWSGPVGFGAWFYTGEEPWCGRGFSYASEYIPEDAVAIKFVIELRSSCEYFGIPPSQCTGESNASPLFDNIRIGAIPPEVLIVPDEYPTIQAAIDATDSNNHDIVVLRGIYRGDGNHTLHFDEVPNNPVNLYSLSYPEFTILDGESNANYAVNIANDHNSDEVLVDGFTFNCFTGAALSYTDSSRPLVLSNCVISGNTKAIFADGPNLALTVTSCTIASNGDCGIELNGGTTQIDRTIIWGNALWDIKANCDDITVLGSAVDPAKVYDPGGVIDWGNPDENVYIDPFFCDPLPPGLNLWGDYTLDAVSPCLPEYSPSGNLIGAYGAGCANGYIATTPEGLNVVINLDENVTMTFDNVTGAGDTRELTHEEGPEVPPQYQLVPSEPPIFYYLTTTAQYEDNIEICIHYDETAVGEEDNLALLHFDSSVNPPELINITTSIDTELDIICGVCTTLSPFVIAEFVGSAVSEDIKRTPLKVYQNYPNPAGGTTAITYQLPMAAEVTAKIYNVGGRLVRVLIEAEAQNAGRHQIHWDGCDDQGNVAESGFYFYQLQAGEMMERRQMILVR